MNLKSHLKIKKKITKKVIFGEFVELKEKIYTPFRISHLSSFILRVLPLP